MDEEIGADVSSFHALKERIASETKMLNILKKNLSDLVDSDGEPDDRGHIFYTLPDGLPYSALKRERRVSKSLDEEVTENILRDKGLYDECTEEITVVDQDKVLAAHFEGKLTTEEIDAMFPPTITWAFITVK
jgi:hypothetical protein